MSQVRICDKCGRKIEDNMYYACEVKEIPREGIAIVRKYEYDVCNACWENIKAKPTIDCPSL